MSHKQKDMTGPGVPRSPGLHESRKVATGLALIVATFVSIVVGLLLLGNARSEILSAMRAFVAGEGFYSNGQKDATHALYRYARTADESDYEAFERALAIPLGDRQARIELEKPRPDMTVVYEGLVAGHNHRDDVANMAMLFRRFRHASFIRAAVEAWAKGDDLVMQLAELGGELRTKLRSKDPNPEHIARILDDIDRINKQLTILEERFSVSLGEGNRRLELRLAQLTYGAAALLVLAGLFIARIVYRRMSDAERERLSVEEALRRSEQRYRSLVAVTTSVVWSTDAAGLIVSPQREWETYTGQAWNRHTQQRWLDAIHPDDRDEIREGWERALADRGVFRCEGRIMHAMSGGYRYFVAHVVPLLDEDGSIREWNGTFTDVDERKRAEAALQSANRQKDEFVAMLAHELRNPLSPIRNAVHVLRNIGSDEPRIAHAHEMIERQVTHMSRLLDDLLDVSRVARGKVSLHEENLDFAQLVRLTTEDYRATLELAGLRLSTDIDPDPVWVRGDATRLAQVIGNLLHNAIKFTGEGGSVTVTLRADPHAVSLSIKDTGIGVEPEHLNSVFDVFTQTDQGLDRTRGGLGLGLALVKGLVQLHGGSVEAFSAGLGTGFEVRIRLPRSAAEEPRHAPPPPAEQPRASYHRVLVVEDNRDVAESVRELLELKGHEVIVAHTGPDAITLARARRPDVVLCDIGLPGGMSGFDVAQTLRGDPAFASVCLIAVTGYGQSDDRRRAHEAGFDMHLIKPIDPGVLDRLMARATQRVAT